MDTKHASAWARSISLDCYLFDVLAERIPSPHRDPLAKLHHTLSYCQLSGRSLGLGQTYGHRGLEQPHHFGLVLQGMLSTQRSTSRARFEDGYEHIIINVLRQRRKTANVGSKGG
jgi:hypothetical protein